MDLNEADLAAWAATEGTLLPSTTVTGTPEQVKARIDDLGPKGVTEVVFQPCGPDTRRELEAMFAAHLMTATRFTAMDAAIGRISASAQQSHIGRD